LYDKSPYIFLSYVDTSFDTIKGWSACCRPEGEQRSNVIINYVDFKLNRRKTLKNKVAELVH